MSFLIIGHHLADGVSDLAYRRWRRRGEGLTPSGEANLKGKACLI